MELPPFFYEIFEFLPRQGPGCTAATREAWSYFPALPDTARVLDIGCGSGTQTIDLAALTRGTITAFDNHQPFLDMVAARARRSGLEGRIRTVNASMDALPFRRESSM